MVEGTDLNQWRDAMQSNTKVCFLESISNPTLEVCDIAGVADIAHAGGAKLVVDNVFATPIFQRTLQLGADIVVYSATKHIDLNQYRQPTLLQYPTFVRYYPQQINRNQTELEMIQYDLQLLTYKTMPQIQLPFLWP